MEIIKMKIINLILITIVFFGCAGMKQIYSCGDANTYTKMDGLAWPYHVSDLKGWMSKFAGIYGVRGIPANFLINGDGVIVARNLRGNQLIETLSTLQK